MKNKILFGCALSALLAAVVSCGDNGVNEILFRPDLYSEAPLVDCFRADMKIVISWHADAGADKYILERRQDGSSGWLGYTAIYEGTALRYEDGTAYKLGNERYEYRLAKVRNNIKYFPDKFTTTLAVAAQAEKDEHEPNNEPEQAIRLGDSLSGNLYSFRFSDNRVIEDTDWYKVSILQGKKASIKVTWSPGPTTLNVFHYYANPAAPIQIDYDNSFLISNDDTVQKDIAFEILPIRANMLPSSGPGGSLIGYTIRLVGIASSIIN